MDPTSTSTFKNYMESYFGELGNSMNNQVRGVENVIILSREITRLSKETISATLRAYQNSNPNELKYAERKIDFIRDKKFPLFLDMLPNDTLEYFRFQGHFTHCVQEFIEALGLLHFIKTNTFLTYESVLRTLTFKKKKDEAGAGTEEIIEVTYGDFILGMLDMFGELTRLCTSVSDSLEKDFVFKTLDLAQQFYCELIKVESPASHALRGDDYRNKIGVLKNSISKIERTLKEMKLREAETLGAPKLLNKALKTYFPTPIPVSVPAGDSEEPTNPNPPSP